MISVKSILLACLIVAITLAFVFPWNQGCLGNASCVSGTVTQIIDGDTIMVNEQSVRLALSSAPELDHMGGMQAKEFVESICPIGSSVLVDEDDDQIKGSYDQMISLVRCNGKILNEELLSSGNGIISTQFCSVSEFSEMEWAVKNGC